MAYSYEDLKGKTIAELREIAKDLHDERVQGYTQMNKEHLLPALCAVLGIDTRHHTHHQHSAAAGFDKTAAKAKVRALKAERDSLTGTGSYDRLKAIRRHIHALKHRLRVTPA